MKLDPRPEYQRAFIRIVHEGQTCSFVAEVTGKQISSRLTSMATANALLKIPPITDSQNTLKEGEIVDALLFAPLKSIL